MGGQRGQRAPWHVGVICIGCPPAHQLWGTGVWVGIQVWGDQPGGGSEPQFSVGTLRAHWGPHCRRRLAGAGAGCEEEPTGPGGHRCGRPGREGAECQAAVRLLGRQRGALGGLSGSTQSWEDSVGEHSVVGGLGREHSVVGGLGCGRVQQGGRCSDEAAGKGWAGGWKSPGEQPGQQQGLREAMWMDVKCLPGSAAGSPSPVCQIPCVFYHYHFISNPLHLVL